MLLALRAVLPLIRLKLAPTYLIPSNRTLSGKSNIAAISGKTGSLEMHKARKGIHIITVGELPNLNDGPLQLRI